MGNQVNINNEASGNAGIMYTNIIAARTKEQARNKGPICVMSIDNMTTKSIYCTTTGKHSWQQS